MKNAFFFENKISGDERYRVVIYEHTIIKFLGKSFHLPVIWSYDNRYSDGDFFGSANPQAGLIKTNPEVIAICDNLHGNSTYIG